MDNFDFDDMLRHGLSNTPSNARFEFKEEYWLQAKALLDADTRRQKRRRVWGYAFVLTMLLAPAAAIYWHQKPTTHSNMAVPPVQETPVQEIPSQQDMALRPNAPVNTLQAPATNVQNDKIGQNFKNTGNDATQSNVIASNIKTHSEIQSAENSTESTFLQSTGLLTKNNRPPQNNQIENIDQSGSMLSLHAAPSSSSISYRPKFSAEDSLFSVPYRNTMASLPTRLAAPSRSAVTMPKLGQLSAELAQVASPTHLITHKHDDRPFKMGLVASLSSPSGVFYQERLGTALGATARYRIFKKIYASADLLWRRNSGNHNIGSYAVGELINTPGATPQITDSQNLDLVQQSNNIGYSFGYTNTQTNSAVRAIHQIELPLSIQYQWHRFALETGLSLSSRLVARRVTEQYTQTSLMADNALSNKDSYFERYDGGGSKVNTGLIGGLHWQPLKHWRIGCRVNWSFMDNSGIQYRNSGYNTDVQKNVLSTTQKRAISAELRTAYLF